MSFISKLKARFVQGQEPQQAVQEDEAEAPASQDKLVAMVRKVELFRKLPDESITALVNCMELVKINAKQVVIREGEEGDYFYVIVEGSATVTKKTSQEDKRVDAVNLAEGSAFGQDALISNAKRNATVIFTKRGAVMRLSKTDFDDHIKDLLVSFVPFAEARAKVRSGSQWLDVREHASAGMSRLSGARVLPFSKLREPGEDLKKDASYICYCDNGRLSSTAAFLLGQQGYDVCVLRGGLRALKRAGLL